MADDAQLFSFLAGDRATAQASLPTDTRRAQRVVFTDSEASDSGDSGDDGAARTDRSVSAMFPGSSVGGVPFVPSSDEDADGSNRARGGAATRQLKAKRQSKPAVPLYNFSVDPEDLLEDPTQPLRPATPPTPVAKDAPDFFEDSTAAAAAPAGRVEATSAPLLSIPPRFAFGGQPRPRAPPEKRPRSPTAASLSGEPNRARALTMPAIGAVPFLPSFLPGLGGDIGADVARVMALGEAVPATAGPSSGNEADESVEAPRRFIVVRQVKETREGYRLSLNELDLIETSATAVTTASQRECNRPRLIDTAPPAASATDAPDATSGEGNEGDDGDGNEADGGAADVSGDDKADADDDDDDDEESSDDELDDLVIVASVEQLIRACEAEEDNECYKPFIAAGKEQLSRLEMGMCTPAELATALRRDIGAVYGHFRRRSRPPKPEPIVVNGVLCDL